MANKLLQSIKFPGLSDTYVVPQIDDTLSVEGGAADAKKTGDKITGLKEELNHTVYSNEIKIDNFVGGYASDVLPKTRKYVIGIIPDGAMVTDLKQLVSANSTDYVKLEKWEFNDTTKRYELSETVTALSCEVDPDSSYYILTFPSFSVSKKTLLTYLETSSSGWLRYKANTPSTYCFSASLTAVSEYDLRTVDNLLAVEWSYKLCIPKDDRIKLEIVEEKANDVYGSVFDETEGVINNPLSPHTNALNVAYVWMRTEPIPKGSTPTINAIGEVNKTGSATIYFLKKNSNNTYSVVDYVTLTTTLGDNPIAIPSGLTDNYDVYVGIYSGSGGLSFSTSSDSPRAAEYMRCPYSDISQSEITMDGSYTLDFSVAISYKTKIDNVKLLMDDASVGAYVVVDINGSGKYTSILMAMDNEPENTVLFIKPGIYEQDMTSCLQKRVILIGADRNQCIIRDTDGRYGHHALYVSCGYFENLTIEEPYISGTSQVIGMGLGAYAVHIDADNDYAIGKQAEFHHCNIRSDFFPAMGVGLRKDMTLILDDCILENNQINGRGDYSDDGSLGALYFHDSNGVQGNQYVVLKNNVFKSKLQYAMCPYQVSRNPQNNRVYCDLINNILYSDVGKYSDTVWFRGDPFNPSTGIFSIGIGYGNSIASLNNN